MEPRRSFRFLKELSEGAFGKVYLSEMSTGDNFKSVVAIKLLHGKWADHEEIVQRSRDEARVLGLLHHRNIIRVEDLTSINGQCAIIMEYLDGVDLKTLVNHADEQQTIIPRKVIFDIGSQIASALEAAYHHKPLQGGEPLNLIHRDIKPSNVMLTRAGDVKVLDFGTAQARFDHREAQTQALAFGSAAYMAPERLAGDPDAPSGDVFSLGVTLYEMVARRSFGKIHLRPEKFDAKLEHRLSELDLTDVDDARAQQIRQTLAVMLSYDAERRPSTSQCVEILEGLADNLYDGSIRRYCREVVAPLREQLEPQQDPNDPLRGSTLFEDRSGFARVHESAEEGPSEADIPESGRTWMAAEEDAEPGDAAPADGAAAEPPSEPAAPAAGGAQVSVGAGIPAPALQMPLRSSLDGGLSQSPAEGDVAAAEDVAAPAAPEVPPASEAAATAAPDSDPAAPPAAAPAAPPDDPDDPDDFADTATSVEPLLEISDEDSVDAGVDDAALDPTPDPTPDGAEDERPTPLAAPGLDAAALPEPGPFSGPGTLDLSGATGPDAPFGADGGVEITPLTAGGAAVSHDLFTAPTLYRPSGAEDGAEAAGEAPADPPAAPETPSAGLGAASHRPPAGSTPRVVDDPPARSGPPVAALVGGLLVLAVVAAGGVYASGALSGGEPEPSSTPPAVAAAEDASPGAEADLLSGGVIEAGPVDAERGTLRLKVDPPGSAEVSLVSSASDDKYEWDGTGTLELVGVPAGSWRTKVTPRGGRAERGVIDVQPGVACTFIIPRSGGDWTDAGCE